MFSSSWGKKNKNYPGGFFPVSFSGGILFQEEFFYNKGSLRKYTCYTYFMEPKMSPV